MLARFIESSADGSLGLEIKRERENYQNKERKRYSRTERERGEWGIFSITTGFHKNNCRVSHNEKPNIYPT